MNNGGHGAVEKVFSDLMAHSFPRRRESRSFNVLLDACSPLNACGDKFIGHDKLIYRKRLFQQPRHICIFFPHTWHRTR